MSEDVKCPHCQEREKKMTDYKKILNEMPITQNETELGAWVNRYNKEIRSALLDAYTGEYNKTPIRIKTYIRRRR